MSSLTAQLSQHTVADVVERTITSQYIREVGRNSYLGHHGSGGTQQVFEIITDHGAKGWGLPLRGPADPRPLIGKNLAELIEPEVGVVSSTALPFDYALHDLAGKITGLPVYALLGQRGESSVRCYSGGIYFDDLDPTDAPRGIAAVEENLRSDREFGFTDFKLKIGRGYRWMSHLEGLKRDIEVTELTRSLFPQAAILVDANDGYGPNIMRSYLEAVHQLGLYWIEEPFSERRADFVFLRELLNGYGGEIQIADGEAEPVIDHLLGLAKDGLLDVALMDVTGYGLTAWRMIMPKFEAYGVKGSPHAWGLPLKTLYAAHMAAGLGNVDIIEGVPGLTLGVDVSKYPLENGYIRLSDRPGFGLELL